MITPWTLKSSNKIKQILINEKDIQGINEMTDFEIIDELNPEITNENLCGDDEEDENIVYDDDHFDHLDDDDFDDLEDDFDNDTDN